jgi:Rieske Fe-S protein
MTGGLVAGYGTFAAMAGRYLYPAKPAPKAWLFVAEVAALRPGDSLSYVTPSGAPVAIARRKAEGGVEDFVALSSTCPHLGCKVHWEGPQNRFFCPCHNGAFDAEGRPLSGPPKEAGQALPRYPLRTEGGLLYLEAELPEDAVRRSRPGARRFPV